MWATVAPRSPCTSSGTPVTVTVRAAVQSAGVKVSDDGLTRTAAASPPTASATVAAPLGTASGTTVQVAVPPASDTRTADCETVSAVASSSLTVTDTLCARTSP